LPSLLLEIGCEELPASACREAEAQLPELCERELGKRPDELYVGPRRLAFVVRDLPERSPDEWVKGPPEHLRDKAAAGFARKQGVKPDALEVRDGFLGVTRPGRPLAKSLPETLDAILHGLAFTKTMRWDESGIRFARPVRWLCAKLDSETIEGYRGSSLGHRFAGGEVEIAQPDAYTNALRAAGVEPDAAERERLIREGLDGIGGWSDPAGVLREVVHLVESPLVLEGTFDERFLALPPRVVETAMQSHQRYFPLEGARFAFVANGGDPATVVEGNERVLEGRLEDAHFTFERDVAQGIERLAERLGSITFVAGAGSFAEKTARLVELVTELGGGEASREGARLAKADQAAELVREFPDLEGHIGAEYARLAGYPEAVCAAIDEHYLPDAADGPLPGTEPGRVLAAADKIDNLTVGFSLGQRPTGSRDPHALRRAAIGLCRLAIEGGIRIDLEAIVGRDLHLLVEQGAEVDPVTREVRDFVLDRLVYVLNVPVDFVRAARHTALPGIHQIAELAMGLASLDSATLDLVREVYIRADHIIKRSGDATGHVDPSLLLEDAERDLQDALDRSFELPEEPRIADAISAAVGLGGPLARFFEEVLVMADDADLRRNRLSLLRDVQNHVAHWLGDLSQIQR
jgi:glycyl-tRNA synthetase beta chain